MYITRSNLNRLIHAQKQVGSFTYTISLEQCLSQVELDFLNKAGLFFQQHHTLQLSYVSLELRPPNPNLVFPPSVPTYHKGRGCTALHRDYKNYYIPDEIKERGPDAVRAFKQFMFDSRRDGVLEGSDAFNISANTHFKLKSPIQKIQIKNSGSEQFNSDLTSMSISILDAYTASIYQEILQFPSASPIHKKIYDLRYFEPNKIKNIMRNSNQEEKDLAQDFSELKAKLILAVVEMHLRESGFDLDKVEESVLMQLGFKKCGFCFH